MKILAAAFLLVPTLAFAQPRATAPPTPTSDCANARAAGRICELTIEAEQVGGEVIRPTGENSAARIFDALGSLFRPRRDFVREIVAAAEDVP